MTLNANKIKSTTPKKRAPVMEPGTYPARLVRVISLGVQKNRPFKNEEAKPPVLKLYNTFEFLDEFLKDEDGKDLLDKPRWLSEEIPFYSLKSERAKSTERYYALDPNEDKKGDWAALVGAPCMITVVVEASKKDPTILYEKIASVSSMRPKEAAKAPPLVNEPVVWDFYSPDVEVFNSFPEWLQEKIKGAVDYPDSVLQKALGETSTPADKAVEEENGSEEEDEETSW